MILDEIQRVRGLLLTIKKFVDQDRTDTRFILTGSADVMTLPKVSESLAGRIEVHNLWPLSIGEMQGHQSSFLKTLISNDVDFKTSGHTWNDLTKTMGAGGYPEGLKRPSEDRREKRLYASKGGKIL